LLSVEHRFICRIVETGDFNTIEKLKIDESFLFNGECKEAFKYLKKHFHGRDTFGSIPSRELFLQHFTAFPWTEGFDSVATLAQEVRRNLLYVEIQKLKEQIDVDCQTDPLKALDTLKESSIYLVAQHEIDDEMLLSSSYNALRDQYDFAKGSKGLIGIPWAWEPLTEGTMGIQDEHLICIYGKPKTGKTSFAIAQGMYAYEKANSRILFYSYEMKTIDMIAMAACFLVGVDYSLFCKGALNPKDEELLFKRIEALAEEERNSTKNGKRARAILAASSSGLEKPGIAALRAKIREFDPDIVIVDGVYMMGDGNKKADPADWKYVTAISRRLKALAKETRIPVIGIMQQQRSGDDVAYSGAFEQDCDLLLKLERHFDKAINEYELHVITKAIRKGDKKNFIIHAKQGLNFSFKGNLPDDYNGTEGKKAGAGNGPSKESQAPVSQIQLPSIPIPSLPAVSKMRGR
jgi:KaiC/GvpD/RAD55 family RecA-like ATPase